MPRWVRLSRVAAGASHSLAVGEDGSLWSWGSGVSSQLGIAREVQYTPARPTLGLERVCAADAGNSHSIAMNDDGSVLYQLGRKFIQPQLRSKEQRIVTVAASSWHSMALTSSGTVLT